MAQEHKGRKNTPAKQSSARTGRPQRKPSYQDRRQFPESASTYRQAKLLLLGCMPALRQTLLELWSTLRSKLSALTIRRRLETMRFCEPAVSVIPARYSSTTGHPVDVDTA